LAHHGAPRAILSDSGPEIDSCLFLALAERLNIASLSTEAQAHHSNGVVERHNAVLKSMVRRLRADFPVAPLQEQLDAAFLAKNSLSVHSGASPIQLMSGSAPRLPSALTDGLPALGTGPVEGDDALRTSLSLLHASRVAHTQAEADVSLRRALASNATNVPPRVWAVGDVVFYWAEGVNFSPGSWRGPAHVTDVAVAKDAVSFQHGNRWVTRSCSQLRLVAVAAPPAPPSLLDADATSSGGSDASFSSNGAASSVDSVPVADASASMLAAARAALHRARSPPPPLPASTA